MPKKELRPDLAPPPLGFRAYADDTPRAVDAPRREDGVRSCLDAESARPELSFSRWSEDAFSPIDDPLPPPYAGPATPGYGAGVDDRRGRKGLLGTLAISAAACAVGIGVGLGWDDLKARLAQPGPPTAVAPSQPVETPLTADWSSPGASVGESPGLTAAPEAPTTAPQAARPAKTSPALSAATPAEPPSAFAAANARAASAVVASRATPSRDCADAGTLAGQLGCDDPAIAQAHRRMISAYGRALDSGASEDLLNADQARWLSLRERAANASTAALLGAYQQRIQEIEASGPSSQGPPN